MRTMTVSEEVLEAIDERIVEAFCVSCPAKVHYLATMELPEEWDCPADFMPSNSGCVKRHLYEQLKFLAQKIEEELEVERNA